MFMLKNEAVEDDQSLVLPSTSHKRAVEIPNALPVRLQRLDVARHVAIAPDGKRYVVATFDDTLVGHGYMTAVYPQQNGYLTLLRLVICERESETLEEAVQSHTACIQAIQRGKLQELVKSLQS
jgi:hypothetical protein